MTPMSGAFDWLAVGDIAAATGTDHQPTLGGGAARLTAHAAALGARTALVAKVGDDDVGRRLREALMRLRVDVRWLHRSSELRTTRWHDPEGAPEQRRIERGADLALRLDELPPRSLGAAITVVSGYSLTVEPARSAVHGALTGAATRGGRAALMLDAELLWWTNARMTRRLLEPAMAAANTVALSAADARVLYGPLSSREATRLVARLGPRLVFLAENDGGALIREAGRVQHCPAPVGASSPHDRYAAPAAFWVGLARRLPAQKAAAEAVRYAASSQRAAAVGSRL